jgi:hypothetical protein
MTGCNMGIKIVSKLYISIDIPILIKQKYIKTRRDTPFSDLQTRPLFQNLNLYSMRVATNSTN